MIVKGHPYLKHIWVGLSELDQERLQQVWVLVDHFANLLELGLIPQESQALGSCCCPLRVGSLTCASSCLSSGSEQVLWLASGRSCRGSNSCASGSSGRRRSRSRGGGGASWRRCSLLSEMVGDSLLVAKNCNDMSSEHNRQDFFLETQQP